MTPEERWEQNVKLAKHMAYRYYRDAPQGCGEDFYQAAYVGLWLACLKYDPERFPDFGKFAVPCISGQLVLEKWRQGFFGEWAGRQAHERKWDPPSREVMFGHEGSGKDLALELVDDHELLEWIVNGVRPARTRNVARWYFLEGLSSATIAHRLGKSTILVQKLHKNAFEQMKAIADSIKKQWEGKAS